MHRANFESILGDPAIRNGIKFALAGTVALYFALLLRLEQPTWAVTTAFVLSTPKFVGAIGEKTVLRILGALAGAVLGYLITGSLQQSPALFLLAMGSLVAFGTAMYGGTFAPYGFRQCGYTATLVASQGLIDPEFSWHVGQARCQEICLGIVVTMVITTVVWPRYAREEFGDGVRGTLKALGILFRERAEGFLSGHPAPVPDVLGTIGGRLAKLRKMIRLGCMESSAFRHRRDKVDAVVSQLGVLTTALSNFGRTLPAESRFRDYIEHESRSLHEAVAHLIETLADPKAAAADRSAALERAGASMERYEAGLRAFRLDGIGDTLNLDESFEHAGYSLSIHEIHSALVEIARLLPEIEEGQTESFPFIRFEKFTPPDADWIRSGIRGGFAVALCLFLVDWIRPPGGDIFIVGTYLFTGFSLEATDRKGDLGVFHTVLATLGVLVVYFFFLLLTAPMMSSYAVLNIFLATLLFFTGYLLEKGILTSFATLVALLMSVILVGLNAQQPVGFESIAGPVLGLMLAAVLSAVLRRLIWPALPQKAFRASIGSLLGLLGKTAENPTVAVPVRERATIALSAADALVLTGVLEQRALQTGEAETLRGYIRSLARLGGHLMAASGVVNLPSAAAELYASERSKLMAEIAPQLERQRRAVEEGTNGPVPVATADPREWTGRCRALIRGEHLDVLPTMSALGLLYRHEQARLSFVEASEASATIRWGDLLADRVL